MIEAVRTTLTNIDICERHKQSWRGTSEVRRSRGILDHSIGSDRLGDPGDHHLANGWLRSAIRGCCRPAWPTRRIETLLGCFWSRLVACSMPRPLQLPMAERQ